MKRWFFAGAIMAAGVLTAGGLVWLSAIAAGGRQAHDALCVLRQDLQRRVATSAQFIQEHPQGFAGISAAVIRKSIRDQQRTVDALQPLHCPDAVPLP